jgi:hypothetical protein
VYFYKHLQSIECGVCTLEKLNKEYLAFFNIRRNCLISLRLGAEDLTQGLDKCSATELHPYSMAQDSGINSINSFSGVEYETKQAAYFKT